MNFCGIFGWCISVGGGTIEWISGFLRWKCRNDCHCHTILVHTCTTTGCSTCTNVRAAHKNLIIWNRWYRLFESLPVTVCGAWRDAVFATYMMSALGITAGAHRLWAHRGYRARLPLRVVLAVFNSMAFQVSLFTRCITAGLALAR